MSGAGTLSDADSRALQHKGSSGSGPAAAGEEVVEVDDDIRLRILRWEVAQAVSVRRPAQKMLDGTSNRRRGQTHGFTMMERASAHGASDTRAASSTGVLGCVGGCRVCWLHLRWSFLPLCVRMTGAGLASSLITHPWVHSIVVLSERYIHSLRVLHELPIRIDQRCRKAPDHPRHSILQRPFP